MLKGCSIQRVVEITQLALSHIGNMKEISCVFIKLHYHKGLGPKEYPFLWKGEGLGPWGFFHTHTPRARADTAIRSSSRSGPSRVVAVVMVVGIGVGAVRPPTQNYFFSYNSSYSNLFRFLNVTENEETIA